MANKKYIDETFDLKGLCELGLIKNTTDYDDIEKRICKWFGLDYIQQFDEIMVDKPKDLEAKNIFSDN
jgi:hypothetical protein